MKVCEKIGCQEPSIIRGKYCENHRTNKKKYTVKNELFHDSAFQPSYDDDLEKVLRLSRIEYEKTLHEETKKNHYEESFF
jgi:hypothetical protein